MNHQKRFPTRWLFAAAVLLALGAAIALFVLREEPSADLSVPDKSDRTRAYFVDEPATLAKGVHLLGALAPGAAYVVETTAGLVLIDTGLQSDGALVTQQMAELDLDLEELRMILITHIHGDHSLGAERLRQLTGAKVCAGAGDVAELERGGPREAFFSTFYMPGVSTHATKIDEALAGGETLQLGDVTFHVIATPGHTPGSVCFLMERGGERILFTGDTISSINGDLGTYAAHLSPRYRASAEDYLASLQKLRDMPAPDLVLPGHPRLERQPQSPRLTEHQWHQLLDRGIDELSAVIARYRADGRDFLDGTPKALLPGLYYLGDFHDWAIYCLQTDEGLFIFDAPGGPELAALIKQQLASLGVEPKPLQAVLLTSCDPAATAGLQALVSNLNPRCDIVAPAGAEQMLDERWPQDARFCDAATVSDQHWFPVRPIMLSGLGQLPLAYELQWHERRIFIGGRIPTRVNEESVEWLRSELTGPYGDAAAYVRCLLEIRDLDPQMWLPARPWHGQNANLYAEQWRQTISAGLALFRPN